MNAWFGGFPVAWLNFVLHTGLISVACWAACRAIRNPGRRAFAAVAGAMAMVAAPWMTIRFLPADLVPGQATKVRAEEKVEKESALPQWTIHIEAAEAPQPVVPSTLSPGLQVRDWKPMVLVLWAAGAVVGMTLLGIRQWQVARWLRRCVPCPAGPAAAPVGGSDGPGAGVGAAP